VKYIVVYGDKTNGREEQCQQKKKRYLSIDDRSESLIHRSPVLLATFVDEPIGSVTGIRPRVPTHVLGETCSVMEPVEVVLRWQGGSSQW